MKRKTLPKTIYNVDKEDLKIVDHKLETLSAGKLESHNTGQMNPALEVDSNDDVMTRSMATVTTQLSNQSSVKRLPSEGT